EACRNEWGPDRARRHRIDANAFLCQRLRERSGEGHDGALRRAVVDQLLAAAIGRDRSRVDDRRALLHVLKRRLGHENVAEDIGLECAGELFLIDGAEVLLRMLFGGIVYKNVEATESVDCLGDGIFAEALPADIALYEQCFAAFGFDKAPGLLGVHGFFLVDDGDLGTLAREQNRTGATDTAVAAGDDGDLV